MRITDSTAWAWPRRGRRLVDSVGPLRGVTNTDKPSWGRPVSAAGRLRGVFRRKRSHCPEELADRYPDLIARVQTGLLGPA